MANKELIEKIKDAIEKSGYELELNASRILNKNDWYVKTNPICFNEETKQYSEIDIVAKKKNKQNWFNMIIIECKKQADKPWVFFKQNKKNKDVWTLHIVSEEDGRVYNWFEKNYFDKHYYYDKNIATYYMNPFGNPNKPNPIYKAINQVVDALIFYFEQQSDVIYEYKKERFVFLYPIIVFAGMLFSAESLDGKWDINEENHIQLLVEREAKNPKLLPWTDTKEKIFTSKPIIIDIVSIDYFEEFLGNFK